jgi:hypothetical protein
MKIIKKIPDAQKDCVLGYFLCSIKQEFLDIKKEKTSAVENSYSVLRPRSRVRIPPLYMKSSSVSRIGKKTIFDCCLVFFNVFVSYVIRN